MKKRWTEKELNYLKKAYPSTETIKNIAIILDRSERAVVKKALSMNVKRNRVYSGNAAAATIKAKGPEFCALIRKKTKDTTLKRYGVENAFTLPWVQKKAQKAITPEVRAKIKKTCLERYGGTGFASEESMNKYKKTMLSRYGVEYNLQLEEMKRKINSPAAKAKRIESYKKTRKLNRAKKAATYKDYCVNYEEKTGKKPSIVQVKRKFGFSTANSNFWEELKGYTSQRSLMDKSFEIWLESLNVPFVKNTRKQIKPLELDYYFPDFKFAIEINDNWSHQDLKKDKFYHLNKTEKCQEKGIFLMHIFEWELINPVKLEVIKSMILQKLGMAQSINAGSCKSKKISWKEASEFLDENHRQGCGSNTGINYGLYKNGKLYSVMTFRKNKTQYELYRFCNKKGYSVRVGATRLFKKFIKEFNPDEVISYSDIAHTTGGLYKILGFELSHKSGLNYFWIKNDIVLIRNKTQKNKLEKLFNQKLDLSLTEEEIMRSFGFYRIYDCGNLVWKYKKV